MDVSFPDYLILSIKDGLFPIHGVVFICIYPTSRPRLLTGTKRRHDFSRKRLSEENNDGVDVGFGV